ncbi:hypothetical protein AJ78_03960 [Emergomyces pasteurianus Ep9510]|uniref:C2H2-type domain-containing protein n=1 Tax=Emergomyces pasteurianus Ep9510 TaxID=1447872 RepID=A0A1J9PIT7_9EURO|nr:hypothetical protein AJ78_03960 [Emergomyces pasteurianus Ep9510]
MASTELSLPIKKEAASLPVFCSQSQSNSSQLNLNKSLRSTQFNAPLQAAARSCKILSRITFYSGRREGISVIARNVGIEIARQIALHKPPASESFFKYDYGPGDVNITEAMLSELKPDHVRNTIRRALESPAMRQALRYNLHDETVYANKMVANDPDVKQFDEILQACLTILVSQFDISPPTIQAVTKKLAAISSETVKFSLPFSDDEAMTPESWRRSVDSLHNLSASKSASFFKQFLSYRKENRRFLNRHFRKQYREKIKSHREAQSTTSRPALAVKDKNIPTLRSAKRNRAPQEEETVQRDDSDQNKRHKYNPDEDDDTNGEDDDDDDDDDSYIDELVANAHPDSVFEVMMSEDSEVPTYVNSAPPTRSQFIQTWLQHSEIKSGRTSCTICAAKIVPAMTNFQNITLLCRHLEGNVHASTHFNDFVTWCRDGRRYACKLCEFSVQNKYRLRDHLQKKHRSFVETLEKRYRF